MVNMIYMMYFIVYMPTSIFIHYPISQKYGILGVIIFSAVFIFVALFLRIFIVLECAILSNLAAAISFTLLVNEIPRFIHQWFPSDEAIRYTTIAILLVPLGMGVGYALPYIYIQNYIRENQDIKKRTDELKKASLFWAIFIGVVYFLLTIPHFKSPPGARSKFGLLPKLSEIFKGIKSLLSNGNFMLLTIVFVLLQLVSAVINCNLAAIIYPYLMSSVILI